MGKKSRRKGGGSAKQKADRREQQLQDDGGQQPTQQQSGGAAQNSQRSPAPSREYFVGDRVWISAVPADDESNPNSYRGVIHDIKEDHYLVITLQAMIDGTETPIRVTKDDVFPDFHCMQLRFKVGDPVVALGINNRRIAGIVERLWPVSELAKFSQLKVPSSPSDMMMYYKVKNDFNNFLVSIKDVDYCIQSRPTSFRFKAGDHVVFDPKKVQASDTASALLRRCSSSWLRGVITATDISREGVDYAAYECSFDVGKKSNSCRVIRDDDEHIAQVDAEPRKRLFDAIEQGCNRNHLKFLAVHFNINIAIFRDLVIAKAIEFASYQALLWLQNDCDIDVLHLKDEDGNNLLHMIAQSKHAARFIREAERMEGLFRDRHVGLGGRADSKKLLVLDRYPNDLINRSNNDNEVCLHILIRRGDVEAIDAAFSPHEYGFAWDLMSKYQLKPKVLQSLDALIEESNDPIVKFIFNSFTSTRTLYGQYEALYHQSDAEELIVLRGESAEHNAKILSRFCLDWKHHYERRGEIAFIHIKLLVTGGKFELFRLLYDAEPRLFDGVNNSRLNEDRNQFIHPQQRDIVKGGLDLPVIGNDVFHACVLGLNYPPELDKRNLQFYLDGVKSHFLTCDADTCPSLQSHLSTICKARKKGEERDNWWGAYFSEKLRLTTDEDDVEGRQKILEYLLRPNNTRLDVILPAMKNRQSWVLRLMLNKGYVNLESQASANAFLVRNAKELIFLESGHIPSSMTTKCCLCFVAVQYDDLQSLQFLCESFGTPVEFVCGWNLLHFSAFMGRIEVVGWISTQDQPVWNSFVSQSCGRKPFQGAFAPHIAISRGHLDLCDLLIRLKGRQEGLQYAPNLDLHLDTCKDEKGKTLEYYARNSEHEFVRKLTTAAAVDMEKKNRQLDLEKNITKLFDIINNEPIEHVQVQDFIISSKCLDLETWDRFCSRFDEKSPMDYSFEDVIKKCCKKVDHELARWICTQILCSPRSFYLCEQFWGVTEGAKMIVVLSRDDLISLAEDRGLGDLLIHLQKKWFKDVSCGVPLLYKRIFESALGGERALEVRAAHLCADALVEIANICRITILGTFGKGGKVCEIRELLSIYSSVRETYMADPCNREIYWRSIDISMNFLQTPYISYEGDHPLKKLLRCINLSPHRLHQLNIVLATEGYAELMRFCLNNLGGWTAERELDAIRIASYFGHTKIVDMFLVPESGFSLLSNTKDRHNAAILGAGEALHHSSLVVHVNNAYEIPTDPIKMKLLESDTVSESLLVAVLNGYAIEKSGHDVDSKSELKTLRFITDKFGYTHDEVSYSMQRLLEYGGYDLKWMACIVELMSNVIRVFGQPTTAWMMQICKVIVNRSDHVYQQFDNNTDGSIKILRWFKRVADFGIDLQPLRKDMMMHRDTGFGKDFAELEQKQLRQWSHFDAVKQGGKLNEIQAAINNGSLITSSQDRGGLHLTHLSAAYDRVDLLEWLVITKRMDLNLIDGERRTALDVATASKATNAIRWITEYNAKRTISSFLRRNHHCAIKIRRRQKLDRAATVIQKIVRSYAIRRMYAGVLLRRLEDSQRFRPVWGKFIDSYDECLQLASWSDIREKLMDIKVGLEDELLQDTNDKLSSAMENAVQQDVEVDEVISEDDDCDEMILTDDDATESTHAFNTDQWLSFQMTSHVVKFLQRGDKKYRSCFVRRMRQLASGERSRILRKPLKGSQSHIFETYLEQKSGHRILFTEEREEERGSHRLVIWYVAKHKQVSRLMQLIDDSKSRSARQHMPDSLVSELQNEGLLPENKPKEVLLDIFGNVPLKIYDVNYNTMNEIAKESWTPQLHLTDEERDIVEAEGTVLVLGRSGTGKTVTVTQRIEFDRQSRPGQDPSFTQLFVARSARLCRYVEGTVNEDNRASFCTYERLLSDVESSLPGHDKSFNPSQKMDFRRFKQEFHNLSSNSEKFSALISWTVIRTFIKGSVEAFQSPDGILPRGEFVEVERLGKNRCRVPPELRDHLYNEFLRYQVYLADKKLWDDCDRVRHLVLRIKESKEVDPDAFGQVQRSKVYVDEVQDYTQLELLLFFYLAGPNGLFLAGDPAQSVVEGTEFRFEEVRSVGHFVGSVIQKPKTVNVNFRSHSGILNCAGGVLDFMFTHFPSSAKQLKKDKGLFQGSRPGVLLGASIHQLNTLLSDKLKGAVVLTHDESAHHWRRMLNDYKVSLCRQLTCLFCL
eukprot:scaffold5878_cov108-Skeletonema_dohrnii-CCMP3373.AAC.2